MPLSTWLSNVVRAVDTEYDRRIRRASNVVAYGTSHGHDETATPQVAAQAAAPVPTHTEETHDDDAVVVVNVPRGTRLSPASTVQAESHDEVVAR